MKTILSRRRLIAGGIGLTVGAPLIAQDTVIDRMMKATPPQQLGPFYPVARPLDQDSDLTQLDGHSESAEGPRMDLFGIVRDFDGTPVPGATLDLWQANVHGRYMHGGDDREDLPLDPHFQGSAKVVTDADGRYRIRTIIPGIYGVGNLVRPRHIHFTIDGKQSRLTTQMYFPGEKENANEDIADDSMLVAKRAPALDGGIAAYNWDVVLPFG